MAGLAKEAVLELGEAEILLQGFRVPFDITLVKDMANYRSLVPEDSGET